jgi:hypothetical protein
MNIEISVSSVQRNHCPNAPAMNKPQHPSILCWPGRVARLAGVTGVILSVAVVMAEDVPLQAKRWHLEMNQRTKATIEPVTDLKGVKHEAIRFRVDYQKLSETQNYQPGTVYVPDLTFHNGTIEADLIGPIEPDDRTFVGIAFRIDPKDPQKHELVYFRPFNSGTERHLHTVQYVATGTIYDWPYLREKFPGIYESGANITNNVWFHARLEIADITVRVFVNDGKEPVLVVKDLKLGDRSGLVGFWGYPGAFANFRVTSAVEEKDKTNTETKP